jgi:hypothetical protein
MLESEGQMSFPLVHPEQITILILISPFAIKDQGILCEGYLNSAGRCMRCLHDARNGVRGQQSYEDNGAQLPD